MTKPLALLLHEKMVPGSKLVSRFEALDYRVVTLPDPADLVPTVAREMPMLLVADLTNRRGDVLAAVGQMLGNPETAHVPVIAYTPREDEKVREAASKVGVRLLATEAIIVPHLEQFVEAALLVE